MKSINWSTIIKLGIASLIVGTVLGMVDVNPIEFWKGLASSVQETFRTVFGAGMEGLKKVISYTAIGAVVVIPVWLVSKLLKSRKRASTPPAVGTKD